MKTIFGFSLLTFIPLIFSTIVMWSDIVGRAEYGKRAKYLMLSLLCLFFAGLVQLGYYLYYSFFDKQLFLILFYVTNALYYIGFFMLEYSIHTQRIQKSFLYIDFTNAVKKTVFFFVIIIIYMIGSAIYYVLSNVLKMIGEFKDPTHFIAVVLNLIYFGSFITAIIFCNTNIFKLQKGIVRQREYTFNTLLIINIIFFSVITFFSELINRFGIIFLNLYTIANIIFIIRLFKEYFYYRTDHLRLSLVFHEELQLKRKNMLEKIVRCPEEEDMQILRSTMQQDIVKSQSTLPTKEYGISGMVLYTAAKNILKVNSKEMIIGHCTPFHEVKEIKHLNEGQINNKILQRSYDIQKIEQAHINELRDISEIALKDILTTKKEYLFKTIPTPYRGLQRFIGAFPVFDNELLVAVLLVYKDNSDYLFPEEEKVIESLIDDIRIILSIIEGKNIQKERNRLQGEINIAKNIQLSILPREINIDGYDCATYMETATEVGGDAYDHVQSKYGNYFGIGDVSGHGLPAGIMALIQMAAFESSVFTAETLNHDINPDKIYNTVNKVLCNINKDRIGSDKFMTQNYLIEKDGRFIHAGTHEIALHYFEKEEEVYELKDFTKKTAFLGISPLINSADSLGTFSLGQGDVLLLYSDGVIEAKNHYSKQFGLQKLKQILLENATLSAKEIIEKVIAELYEYARDGDIKRHGGAYADDVSLFVIKKL